MRLIKIAAVIGNGCQRHFIFGHQSQAELKAGYLVEGFGRKAGILVDQFVEVAGGNTVLRSNEADAALGIIFIDMLKEVANFIYSQISLCVLA